LGKVAEIGEWIRISGLTFFSKQQQQQPDVNLVASKRRTLKETSSEYDLLERTPVNHTQRIKVNDIIGNESEEIKTLGKML
jgi:hypothetical protein